MIIFGVTSFPEYEIKKVIKELEVTSILTNVVSYNTNSYIWNIHYFFISLENS
jgi:hypothetical protein